MNIDKFIKSLGGTVRVSVICGVTKGAVSQWKRNGIPKAQVNFLKTKFPKQFREAKREEER